MHYILNVVLRFSASSTQGEEVYESDEDRSSGRYTEHSESAW